MIGFITAVFAIAAFCGMMFYIVKTLVDSSIDDKKPTTEK